MEIILVIMVVALISIFTVDTIQKRRAYIAKSKNDR